MATQNMLNVSLSGQSGTDAFVGSTSPTLITPSLDAATATSVNKVNVTSPASGATLTIVDGKTLTVSNTLTFTGTDGSSVAFGTGGTAAITTSFGSWTPTFTFTTPGNLSVAYATQIGSYIRIGNMVIAELNLTLTPTYTTSASSAIIGGLPFPTNATSGYSAAGSVYISSTDAFPTSRPHCTLRALANASTMNISFSGTGLSFQSMSVTQIISGVQISFIGTLIYLT